MRVTYTGLVDELSAEQKKKLERKYNKLAKLLDTPLGEKEAHVILKKDGSFYEAEITLNYSDHTFIGEATSDNLFTALNDAIDKLEKQILKFRTRRIDLKRNNRQRASRATPPVPSVEEELASTTAPETKPILRISEPEVDKPMTVEEAMMLMEDGRDYLVYRDAASERLAVLIRRSDGSFVLIQPEG